jgi:DNA-binding transcriptional MerR regulator
MTPPSRNLSPAQAVAHFGVSAKALRLYEQRGMITPGRSAAGWRLYSPEDLARISEILTVRRLGLNLTQVTRALDGDSNALDVKRPGFPGGT